MESKSMNQLTPEQQRQKRQIEAKLQLAYQASQRAINELNKALNEAEQFSDRIHDLIFDDYHDNKSTPAKEAWMKEWEAFHAVYAHIRPQLLFDTAVIEGFKDLPVEE